ncbi:unnamed protein product [Somion occarium]|uniref:Uncharacterized protein n=1 Tax=Somion occarium TaxID=3059160 RepID=A0ABP1DWI5_9APHY
MKEEMARLTEENNYFRERYLHTSNPLPPPPQLVPMDHLDSMMNDASGPGRTQTLSPIPESQEDPRAHRLRRPVMRPGAPPPMKVIPPHLQNPAQIWKYANPKPTSAPNPPELEQLEVLNIRAGPSSTSELRSDDARHATHGPSVSSESLERVQTRAAYPSNYRPEHTDGYGHDVHGLELEGILPNDSQPSASRHMSLTQHNTGEEQHEASALAFDPGLNRGYQITPRPGTSGLPEPSNEQAYVGERGQMEADPELGVQLAVFALPLERDGSPSTTPRSPFRQLMAGNASASSSLSDLPLGITGPGLSSSSRSQHSTVAQAPSSGPTMAAQQMYSVPSAASSSNSWGTVHHSRQSSFASLHLARFPEPAEDSQPPSANPSVHDLGRLPIFPNTQPAAASTSNRDESPPAPMESSQSSSQAEHPPHNVASAGGARDSRQERSRVSLPLDDRAPSNAYPRGPRPSGAFRTTSSLNLGLTSLTGNLQSSLPQLLNGQGSFSSLSSLVSVNESVGFGGNFGRSGSPAEERRTSVPTRAQTARPESARLQPASSSLEDVRTSRRTGSDQGYVSEATSKSSSQPSLPSSSQAERPRQARHISMPATPANYDPHSGVGRRSGVPLYASPNHSTSHTAIGSNSNHTSSSSSQDRLQTSTDSRNPGTSSQTPPEEPLAREQPRQRRHSTRNVSTPAVFSRAQSSSQTPHPGSSSSSLIRSHTVSVTPQALPRSSTTSLGNTSYLAPLGGGLMLTMEPPSTSSAATADGQPDSSIHAPRPVNNRRSGLFGLLGPRSAR